MRAELNSGNLPEGIHRATEDEVLARFATTTARRQWLGERLRSLLAVGKSTGKLERIFLWGSFVTDKPLPNDLDLLLVVADDFSLDSVPAQCAVLFDHTRARIFFHADVFWTKSSIDGDILRLWLDTYQTGKDFNRRGIVEVVYP